MAQHYKHRPAKGRGNQGDWIVPTTLYGEDDKHAAHNRAVEERKRQRKQQRKQDKPHDD